MTGLAARRFYRSFYQWTINSGRLSAGHRSLHITRPACKEDSSLRVVKHVVGSDYGRLRKVAAIRQYGAERQNPQDVDGTKKTASNGQPGAQEGEPKSSRPKGGRRGRGKRQVGRQSTDANTSSTSGPEQRRIESKQLSEPPTVLRRWVKGSVLSPVEKPFSSFQDHEWVIRYRSPDAVMLEYAILDSELKSARAKYGPGLKGLSDRSGARLEVQNITAQNTSDERINSVLISGTFVETMRVRDILSGLVDAFAGSTVHSQESKPSSSLLPLQDILRSRSRKGSHVCLELSLRDGQWLHISDQDWARIAMNEGIALEISLPEERPIQEESPVTAPARSLTLRGPATAVMNVRNRISRHAGTWTDGSVAEAGAPSPNTPTPAPKASAPQISTSKQLESGATNEAIAKSPSRNVMVEVANKGTSSTRKAGSTDGHNAEKALPRSGEQLVKGSVVVNGAVMPAARDAIWSDLAQRTYPDVRIFRGKAINRSIGYWHILVFGSSIAVGAALNQIKAVVAETCKRMQYGDAFTSNSLVSPNIPYRLTFTGKDALKILEQDSVTLVLGELKEELRPRFDWYPSSQRVGEWYVKFKVTPENIGQFEERVLEAVRKTGKELGASDVKGTTTIETTEDELPGTAEPAGNILSHPTRHEVENAVVERKTDIDGTVHMESRPESNVLPPATTNAAKFARGEEYQEDVEQKRPELTPEQQKQLTEGVRASLRSLTHPVVLITSRIKVGRSELSPGLCARGVTVSSFNTVTLDPRPIVSFNLKVPSRSWDAIQQSQKLRIHLLEASERGAAIAQVFTKPYERPEMGFTELRKLGVGVKVTRSNSAPVVQDEQGAVLARLEAELLPEKCVEVGDHVVVLAEVTGVDYETEREGSANGLAYAKRAYRTCGSEVDPENVTARTQDGLYDALSLDGTGSEPQASAPRSRDEGAANVDSEDPHASFKLDHDPIYSALRATKDAAESGEDLDIYAAMAWEDEGLDNSDFTVRNPNREAPRNPSTANEVSTGSSDTNYTPLSSSSGRREFSAISRVPGSTRNFSSTATAQRDDEDRASTLDPSAKNTTVADFLGIPDDNKPLHSPRVRSLLRFQKEIQKAESRLSREELREEDVAALHGTVAYQERIIARKIAWNAAADLRLMLDKGSARVDFKRAQWLESAVEQGLKVLLEDARTLRQRREEGKVNAESYEVLKNKLESDYGVLQTELMRLRGVVDEDEEGGSE